MFTSRCFTDVTADSSLYFQNGKVYTLSGTLTLNGGGSACTGTAVGTGTVVNGNGTLTITSGSIGGGSDAIAVTGTMSSAPYTIQVMFSGSGSLSPPKETWPLTTPRCTTPQHALRPRKWLTGNPSRSGLYSMLHVPLARG